MNIMKNYNTISRHILFLCVIAMSTVPANTSAHESNLYGIIGYNSWNERQFTINGANIEFEQRYAIPGFNYTYLFRKGLAITVGVESGSIDLIADSSTNTFDNYADFGNIKNIHAQGRYYFSSSTLRSYIGAGAGNDDIIIHASGYRTAANAELYGAAFSTSLGIEAEIYNRLGFILEYKHNNIFLHDTAANMIRTSSREIILGIRIRVGHKHDTFRWDR